MKTLRRVAWILPACLLLVPGPARALTQAQKCEKTVASALPACITTVGAKVRKCYLKTGHSCDPILAGSPIAKAVIKMSAKIHAQCPPDATVQTLGYGASATPDTVAARIQEACLGEVASIAARTFGGPQGALLVGADTASLACYSTASNEAFKMIKREASARGACLKSAHAGKTCDPSPTGKTAVKIAAIEAKSLAKITPVCPNLKAQSGLDPAGYIAHAAAQARCVTAAGHGDSSALPLDCGARPSVPLPARDTWTQVVLDEATYGTRCGDGSPYAFWVRLPPSGKPSEKVAIDLQGGGVCIFKDDPAGCSGVPADLFSATDDPHPTTGLMSTSASDNPFSDWTMVFLPYCTQDVHIGGGVTTVLTSGDGDPSPITVNRYGAVNVRAALRYVRDVLWQDLAATEAEGYRPDRLTVLFGGESAGGFGVNYNYHYLLDDLRWAHTTAIPDAGLALDNGTPLFSVKGLGLLLQAETGLGWAVKAYEPPYCQDSTGACAIGPHLQAVHSVRLKAVPEQQIINISNQIDETQVTTTFFPDDASWINALRTAYCDNRGRNGIRNWLPAVSTPYHTILTTESRWTTVTAVHELLPDFLAAAIAHPDAVTDHVDEGTLVADYPGVNPLGCPGSPSGAFLD